MNKVIPLIAGILFSISFAQAQTSTGITLIDDAARPGETIEIFGHFVTANPGDHIVSFNGVSANVLAVNGKVLSVVVPDMAFGPASVVVETASFISSEYFNFTVLRNNSGEIKLSMVSDWLPNTSSIFQTEFGDIDDDGFLDLVGVGNISGTFSLFWQRNDGEGIFLAPTILTTLNATFVYAHVWVDDYDNDGRVDIAVGNSGNSSVFFNDGDQTFTRVSAPIFQQLSSKNVSYDINYDGTKDFIIGYTGGAQIVRNNGDRTFTGGNIVFSQEYDGETYSNSVDVVDINNDSFADVLVASERRGWSRAYLNDPSNPGFFTERININAGLLDHKDIMGADINNDGWNDVVSATENTYSFLSNLNTGNNSFELYNYVAQFVQQNFKPERLNLSDLNSDGYVDFIGSYADRLIWSENVDGEFQQRQIFNYGDQNVYLPLLSSADIDNDGDFDITVGNTLFLNQQNNNEILDFSIPGQLGEAIIDSANQTITISVEAATDVTSLMPNFMLSADATATISGVQQESGVDLVDFTNAVAYEVTSEFGSLSQWNVTVAPRLNLNFIEPPSGIPGTIVKLYGSSFEINRPNNTVTFDGVPAEILNDPTPSTNHLTVVVPNSIPGNANVVVSNSNGSSFDRTNFTVVDTSQDNGEEWNVKYEWQSGQVTLTSIETADLNGDGEVEIISTSSGDGKLFVRFNLGSGQFSEPIQFGPDLEGLKLSMISDFNRDGHYDILVSSLTETGWLENNGVGELDTYHIIDASELPIINLADVDGDGDIDLTESGLSYLTWWENDGLGNFTERVSDQINIGEGFAKTFAGDFDDDGLYDLILGSFNGSGTELYTNGGGTFSFNRLFAPGTWISPNQTPWGRDLNGDGLIDPVVYAGNLFWLNNLGDDNYGSQEQITFVGSTHKQYDFADVDADGDVDFGYAIDDAISLHFFENGLFNSSQNDLVNVFALGANRIHFSDFDSDGDMDVLAADAIEDVIYVIENQNTQNELISFSISEQIEINDPDPVSLEIVIGVPSDTDLASISPSFELSFKAKAFIDNEELISGVTSIDFSTDKLMKVVSESGDTIYWNVRILPIPQESLNQLMLFVDQTTAIYTWSSADFADSYEIEVSTDPSFTSTIPGYGPATSGGDENSKLILGLSAGTQYYLRIRSVNQAGVSSYSEVTQLLTLPATPQIRIDSIYQEQVDISWSNQSNVGLYRLDVSTDGFQTFVLGYSSKIISGSETSTSITGLEPGIEYFIRMSSQNQSGESPTSQFRSLSTIPATPVAEEAESITPVSFEAGWQTVTNGVTGYVLQVFNLSQEVVFEGSYLSSQTVDITGLNPGELYAYIVYSYNAFGFSPPSEAILVQTIIPDPISIDITEVDLFPVSSPSIEIDILINGGWGERVVVLQYRGLSSRTFEPDIILNSISTDQYRAIISPSMLDDMGIYYRVATLDELGNGKISDGSSMRWSFEDELDFTIPFDNFGGGKNNWQMFSIPYELEDDLIESVFDEIGNADYKKAWRLMSYRNQGGVGEYIDFGEGINRVEPGKGYWFNSIDRVEIKLDGGQITEEIPFTMELEPGWNQIGNPYPVPINWTTVVTQNAVTGSQVGNLQVFDGSVQFQTTTLYPFQGAFVWSDTGNPITIDPATAKANGKTDKYVAKIENSDIDNGTWQVDLFLSKPDGEKRLGGFGMHPMANELKDDFDEMTIPRFFSYTSLSTYKPEFIYPWFTTDIVLEKEAFSKWDFNFESNSGDSQYDITWDNSAFAQSSAALFLLDLNSGKLINMKEESRVQVTPKNSFRILFNKNPELIDFGNKWIIGTVYPNPAESRVTIPLIIPESSDVEVSIMDLQGKTVKVLRSGRLNEGHHELNWNLDSYSGQKVGSGVYILMLKYGEMQQTMYKRLIVR